MKTFFYGASGWTRPIQAAIALCLAFGCTGYSSQSLRIRTALDQGHFDEALAEAQRISSSRSQLLYLYETGLVLRAAGRYKESNDALAASEDLLADLYTHSVTREVASLAVSDVVREYRGAPFEAALVNYYQILNYLALGDVDGALVECRQASRMLQMLHDAGDASLAGGAALEYVTALVYELGGERQDAAVSYRSAARAFESDDATARVPPWFFCDAAANARDLGDVDEAEELGGGEDCHPVGDDSTGRVNLFVGCGYVSRLVEQSINLPIFKDDEWKDEKKFAHTLAGRRGLPAGRRKVKYWLRVALPSLSPGVESFSRLRVTSRPVGLAVRGVRAQKKSARVWAATLIDVDDLAARVYDARAGSVMFRAVVRALIKYGAKRKADKKNAALGTFVNIVGAATEAADTRSWSTLPGKIMMARLVLPAGRWNLQLDLFDGIQRVGTVAVDSVCVHPDSDTFVSYRVYR